MSRFTRIWLLAASAVLLALPVFGQGVTMHLDNVSVQEAMKALNKSSRYSFSLNSEELDLKRKISVAAEGESLEKVLEQIFEGQDVEWKINGQTISVNYRKQQPQQKETAGASSVTT